MTRGRKLPRTVSIRLTEEAYEALRSFSERSSDRNIGTTARHILTHFLTDPVDYNRTIIELLLGVSMFTHDALKSLAKNDPEDKEAHINRAYQSAFAEAAKLYPEFISHQMDRYQAALRLRGEQ